MNVSIFPNINQTTQGKDLSIESVLRGIREGKWRTQVELVRRCESKTELREAKKTVPYFTVSGTFSKRCEDGLTAHSGFVALDVDADKNPGVDLKAKRQLIEQDTFTYSCFTSVGGAGFCAIVRIPTEHHAESFRALQAFYKETYSVTIDSLPDVSRPRFVSYDPALYFKPTAPVFEETIAEPEPKKPVPTTTWQASRNGEGYGQVALRTAVNKVLSAVDGTKHVTLNKMAFLCGGYIASGFLREDEAREALQQAIGQRELTDTKNAFKTIEDGLRDGQKKPVLPEQVQYTVRNLKREREKPGQVVAMLAATQGIPADVLQPAVEAIYAEEDRVLLTFWDVMHKEGKTKAEDVYVLQISRAKYINWLASAGFAMHQQGKHYVPVHIENNIVREVTRAEIKKFVSDYVSSLPFEFDNVYRIILEDRIQKEHRQLFEDGTLEFLPVVGESFVRDTKQSAYFFFRNVWVEVTKAAITPRPYSALPGRIWATQCIDRDFTGFNLFNSFEVANYGEFGKYLQLITADNSARLDSLTSALGYLMHRHKSRTECYAVVLCDEAITRGGAAGRTGKGLLVQALEKLRTLVKLDGKNFDITRQFAWQRVRHDTDMLVLDDLDAKKLPFEKLFSIITTGMEVEMKGGMQQYIDFHDAPKFLINTNDTLVGEGASHEGRKVEIEVASYFSAAHTPRDEFGHELFDEWEESEWMLFDNLMLRCCQRYLAKGVKKAPPINLNRRKLIQKTSEEFADFARDEIKLGQWYGKRTLWTLFRDLTGFDEKTCSQRKFNGWLKDYAYYEGLTADEQRDSGGYAGLRDTNIRFSKA
ncbi:BT4734/BF3469 family protein [Hymenobacter cavernae]|uniref:BT4734-like N-terminal domain-containing protein n=1 Tax=Hymenobacter cavernae TaxID=2044852 RepID=A0ABQ1UQ70_9BACT|nr:BT4734/BF3469 family protein [Hymenobacter cavernae]GGF22431.1 hypothetical protein GCM10011383_37580 [Hymenobacter cavernae]